MKERVVQAIKDEIARQAAASGDYFVGELDHYPNDVPTVWPNVIAYDGKLDLGLIAEAAMKAAS